MIVCKLAKAVMEHEEGLNHLWIRLMPGAAAKLVRLRVLLPEGLHRHRNANGFEETAAGDILIENVSDSDVLDVVVELYTSEPAGTGAKTIVVERIADGGERSPAAVRQTVSITLLPEEEMGDAEVDPEVLRYVKSLQPDREPERNDRPERLMPPTVITIDP
ncbi:hypothetical protein [Paenibacillus sp. GYB003]|uniref:hypothetical protein n=1 Tax=Paenibacillus sp. GYB003 TaxID=2994392 RepID=UPI002F9678D3